MAGAGFEQQRRREPPGSEAGAVPPLERGAETDGFGAAPASYEREPVDTKSAERRDIRYETIDDLKADLDAIERAHKAGTLTTTGNWTPGQIFQHCANLWQCALDGFPDNGSWILRVLVRAAFLKKILSSDKPPPAGFKIPKQAGYLAPDDEVKFEEGLRILRTQVNRVAERGEKFTHPSPLLGKLTHEQWTTVQLGHCRLHLSFLRMES